ncbi:hypothetical protein [Streptomyces sp. ME19-01-6]|uniref:hypothetical protein n=1 Tax=Streptomyces sp. ME19-01-6 TaxID=3028686 RepID=UPI0029A98ADA|nr:hypothetical protein [Streptomyces sp. ME19-01-6]MDX3229398.1 hypothetical protein [Streptomyces sp. ME19-01-6]
MYPIGSKVTIKSVDHLGRLQRPKRLLGRTAVITGHEDGMNEVALIHFGKVSIGAVRWMFNDSDLSAE